MYWQDGKIEQGEYKQISGQSIFYEVLRVINGRPVFLYEHLDRLKASSMLGNALSPEMDLLVSGISDIIAATLLQNCNLRIDWVPSIKEVIIYEVPHHYPVADDYKFGVSLHLLYAERLNPNAKIWRKDLRTTANDLKERLDVYEILLVNKNNEITEGSRSNIFFIKGDTIYTPPVSQVLNGITRQKVLEICDKKQIKFVETEISVHELRLFDAVFITGTSPKVLPVKSIDKQIYCRQNEITEVVVEAYDEMIRF